MKHFYSYSLSVFLASALLYSPMGTAQEKTTYLTAAESDPVKLGWMVSSSPPPDRILHFEDGSFFEFPALRWSVAHMRQFMPTVNVSRGLGNAIPLSVISGLILMP